MESMGPQVDEVGAIRQFVEGSLLARQAGYSVFQVHGLPQTEDFQSLLLVVCKTGGILLVYVSE